MPLPFVVESLDKVEEAQRGFYKDNGGKYYLDIEGGPDVTNLKKALDAEREARSKAEKQAKAFDGLDPEEARKALKEIEKSKGKEKEADTEIQRAIQEMTQKVHKEQVEPLQGKLTKAETNLRQVLIDKTLLVELGTQSVNNLLQDAVLLLLKQQIDVTETDTGYSVIVKDSNGKTRYNLSGEPMSIEEFVKEFKATEKGKAFFNAPDNSGGGRPGEKKPYTGADGQAIYRSQMKPKQIAEFVKEHGKDAYLALPHSPPK